MITRFFVASSPNWCSARFCLGFAAAKHGRIKMLPPLAFSDATVSVSNDVRATEQLFSGAFRKLDHFSPVNDERDFQFKMAAIKINDITLITSSSNGIQFEAEDLPTLDLIFPLQGGGVTEMSGARYEYQANTSALVAICEKQRTLNTGSGVALRYDIGRLQRTFSSMMGVDDRHKVSINPRLISLLSSGVAFPQLFKSLFSQIEAASTDPYILEKLAIDDAFYRLSAGLLYPEILLKDEFNSRMRPYIRSEIVELCEYLRAHLTEPISLTKMEQKSKLSARVLQYSFQRIFSLRPKEWLRKQRLHAARTDLLKSKDQTRITVISYDYCFASPSEFSKYYQREFGELPSQTTKNARR